MVQLKEEPAPVTNDPNYIDPQQLAMIESYEQK